MMDRSDSLGYVQLLRTNPAFRRLWFAQWVSEIGDHFNLIALLQLLALFSSNANAIAYLLILQTAPGVLFSPFAGILADRLDRRLIMMATDVGRAFVVLGFLGAPFVGKIWFVYVLAALQFSLTVFFEPARSALIPNLVKTQDWLKANSLSAATWSATLVLGSSLGGVAVAFLGRETALIIDAFSFVASAFILARMTTPRAATQDLLHARTPRVGFWAFFLVLFDNKRLFSLLFVKAGASLLGGACWMMSILYGQRVFPIGKDGAISVGLLGAAMGLGAMAGTLGARRLMTGPDQAARLICLLYALRIPFIALLAKVNHFAAAAVLFVMTSFLGSLLWVLSTSLIQQFSSDEIRGRLFSLEYGFFTVGFMGALYLTGWALDDLKMSFQHYALAIAASGTVLVFLWGWISIRWNDWKSKQL